MNRVGVKGQLSSIFLGLRAPSQGAPPVPYLLRVGTQGNSSQ